MTIPAEKSAAWLVDGTMCNLMHAVQWRRRADTNSTEELAAYLAACANTTRADFFKSTQPKNSSLRDNILEWDSPLPTPQKENNRVRVRLFPARDRNAPTVLILHALMSASDTGYRRLAAWFNDNGWSAAFPHLPYHYSRTPRGTWNGELAITSNLVRNAEGVRQCVVELRQLMTLLRIRGVTEFGMLGTSYGGWTGALLSFLEPGFRFISLIQPIVNMDKAVWENPGAAVIRSQLRRSGHARGNTSAFDHLGSPLHGQPLSADADILITAGVHDRISPLADLHALAKSWPCARLLPVHQGHFGYRALRETVSHIEKFIAT